MVISGTDASNAARVVFATNPTQRLLKDPNGLFWREVDGNKVLSNTPLNAGAERTLELIKMDLNSFGRSTAVDLNTTSVPGGQLHPTNDPCSKGGGGLVENCPSLFYGKCNKSTFDNCMKSLGQMAAAEAYNNSSWRCASPPEIGVRWREDLELYDTQNHCMYGKEEDGRPTMNKYGCYDCAPQWLVTPDTICPSWSEVDHTVWKIGNLWTFNLGKDDICHPIIQ
jgi:hypothetical protein